MNNPRSLREWFVIVAWVVLAGVAVLLLYNSGALFEMFTGHAFAARFSARDLSPREILRTSRDVAIFCYSVGAKGEGGGRLQVPRAQRIYDPIYNNLVQREEVAIYRLEKGIVRGVIDGGSSLSRCLHHELSRQLSLEKLTIDPEILWIYLIFQSGGHELLAIWPAVEVEDAFRAKDRPWYPTSLTKAGASPALYKGGHVWQTRPYNDVFTGESVVSMLYGSASAGGGMEVYSGLDVRADPFPSTFHLVIFLNFISLLIFSIINALVARQLRAEFAYSWYWAWLCWALLYALYSIIYLLRVSIPFINAIRFDLLDLVPVLSIANNAFFALAALQLLGIGDKSKRLWVCFAGAIFAAVAFFLAAYLEEGGTLDSGSSRWVDAVCSFLVTGLLGWAFVAQIRPKGVVISGSDPISTPVAQSLVGSFFLIFALHQLEIAGTAASPVVDQMFWMFSLLMKIGIATLYYMMIFRIKYREEGEVGAIVFERMEQGVIAVDEGLAILAINGSAAELVGVRRVDVLGRDVREVAFRSLFETERLLGDLSEKGIISAREVLMKRYPDGYPGRFHDVVRLVSAQMVKDSEVDRIFALLYLQPSGRNVV